MMPILDDHSTLIFLHIPKTGGMSVTKILESCFDPDTYPPHIANFQALKQVNDLFSKRLITGHYAYQDIISLDFPHDVYYMTWLRDPVERVVSHFYYLKTHEDHAHHSQVTAYNTIDEFLRDDAMRLFYDNLQTRFLAAPFDYYTQPDFSDDDQRHMLERATANLSSMGLCGADGRI